MVRNAQSTKMPDEIKDREGHVVATFTDIHADRIEVLRVGELLSWLEGEKCRLDLEKADALEQGAPTPVGLAKQIRLRGHQINRLAMELGRLRRVRREDFDGVSPSLTVSDMERLKTREEMVAHLNLLHREKDEIKTKIDQAIRDAAENGVPVDADWLTRAERARRNRIRKIALVGQLLAKLREERKAQQPTPMPPGSRLQRINAFNSAFLDVAKERLAPDLFESLLAQAKERVAAPKKPEDPMSNPTDFCTPEETAALMRESAPVDPIDEAIEHLLNEIDPYRLEQGNDLGTTRALRELVRRLLREKELR